MLKVIVSNHLEFLIHALGDFLFHPSNPLIKKNLLVTPSLQTKNFLRPILAKKYQLITGVEFCSLEQALSKVLSSTSQDQPLPYLPPEEELFLWLHPLLSKARESQLPSFQGLKNYLKDENELQMRLKHLSQQLSQLFPLYLHYGQSFLLEPEQLPVEERWQVEIFYQLLDKLNISNFAWTKIIQEVKQSCRASSPSYQKLAVYGLNFLSSSSLQLLKTLSTYLDIQLYLFSPCTKFWTDSLNNSQLLLSSATEASDDFEFYLNHRHPLLSNWGGVLRNRIRLLEDEKSVDIYFLNPLITEESRYLSVALSPQDFQALKGPQHLLSYLQHDVLLFHYPQEEITKSHALLSEKAPKLHPQDRSVEVHICPNPLREVEVLHQNLLNYLHQHQPLSEDPILILAPDIEPYSPFIEHVFQNAANDIPLTFCQDQARHQHSLKHGLHQLFTMAYESFSPQKLLDFLIHPLVKKQLSLSSEELQLFTLWLKSHTIHWGLSPQQQNLALEKNLHQKITPEDLKGDALSSLKQLLRKMAYQQVERQGYFHQPDLSQSPILGKFLGIVERLGQDLNPIFLRQSLPLYQWLEIITSYLRTYFYLGEEHYVLEEAKELFKRLQLPDQLCEERMEFDLLWPFLQKALKANTSSMLPEKDTLVKVGSFHSFISLPAQAIFCLGMSQEAFPSEEPIQAFNLLTKTPSTDYLPSQADLQRSYFLEKLISTREKIFFSYSPIGKIEEKASSLIQELFSYIDQHFLLNDKLPSETLVTQHPDSSLDLSYFSKPNFEKNFEPARAKLVSILFKKPHPPRSLPSDLPVELPTTLSLSTLENALQNPLKIFFKKHYAMSFFDSLIESPYEEDGMQLKAIEKYWIQDLHEVGLEEKWEVLSQKKALFSSPLTQAIWQNAREELKKHLNLMEKHGYCLKKLYTLHLCEKPQPLFSHAQHQFLAPVTLLHDEKVYSLLASFSCMHQHSLLLRESLKSSTLLKLLPKLSIFFLAIPCSTQQSKVIFLENSKTLHLAPERAKTLLTIFLRYYFKSLKTPSGLLPELIPALIEENPQAYAIAFQGLQEKHLKTYTKSSFYWTHRNFPNLFDYSKLLKMWKDDFLTPLKKELQHCLEVGENL